MEAAAAEKAAKEKAEADRKKELKFELNAEQPQIRVNSQLNLTTLRTLRSAQQGMGAVTVAKRA